ncbi:hypothetical protein STEG23_031209, partial [Scotinomys teguina]
MARKAGQGEEEEVAQSDEGEERRQPAMKRRCRVTDVRGLVNDGPDGEEQNQGQHPAFLPPEPASGPHPERTLRMLLPRGI